MSREYNMPEWLPWEQNASPMLLTLTLNAGMGELREHFGTALWTTVILFEEGQAQWMFRPKELKLLGQKMIDYLLCPAYRVAFQTGYEQSEGCLLAEAKRIQFEIELPELTSDALMMLFEEQCKRYYEWYKFGWFCEPVQFQGQDILSAHLEKHKDKLPEGLDAATAVKALLAVEDVSFATEILEHLAECAGFMRNALGDNAFRTALTQMEEESDFAVRAASFALRYADQSETVQALVDKAREHSEKFFWKQNNYFSTQFVAVDDVLEELFGWDALDLDDPEKPFDAELEKIRAGKERDLATKQEILDVLPAYERGVATLTSSVGGSLIDKRKRTIMIANSAFDRILTEVAQRTNSEIEDCLLLIPQELRFFLEAPDEYSHRLGERKRLFVVYQGDFSVLDEMIAEIPLDDQASALQFGQLHMEDPYVAEGDVAEGALVRLDSRLGFLMHEEAGVADVLQGVTTYFDPETPVVEGVVRVIRDPKRELLEAGEILVAPSTTPDYAEAIRRCQAIITDWGGQTSHAAIVSRELGKPCIIGTNYASRVLKNGMKVHLDLGEGAVTIIE